MKKWVGVLTSIVLALSLNVKTANAIIKIKQEEIYLGKGSSEQLEISGNENDVRIRSGNTDVAIVENNTVTAVNTGTAYITVSDGLSTDICKVIVVENFIPISNLTISKKDETLRVTEKSQIIVNISPTNATSKKVTYTSNNPSVATVDANGIVTAKKVGKTYITVSAGHKTAIYNVNVIKQINLKSISITSTLTIQEGDTNKINVTYNPTNATNKTISWKSSNNRVATVDAKGNVTAVSIGSATITATSLDGKHIATCSVIVTANKNSKEITLIKEINMKIGEEQNLTANYNSSNAENKKTTWSSSDENVVIVDANGKIKAISPGKAEIKAKTEQGEAKCTVTVTSGPIKAISFSDKEITVYTGSKTTLITIPEPENTAIINPIWTSSNEDVATVKNGTITAKKIGTTTITVSNKEGDIKASIDVIVEENKDEKLLITIEGYDLNFDENKKNYKLLIGNEDSLDIKVNRDNDEYFIGGNRDLKNGSIITITIKDETKTTYVINIKKKQDSKIYFISFIIVLIFINIIRLLKKNQKKK